MLRHNLSLICICIPKQILYLNLACNYHCNVTVEKVITRNEPLKLLNGPHVMSAKIDSISKSNIQKYVKIYKLHRYVILTFSILLIEKHKHLVTANNCAYHIKNNNNLPLYVCYIHYKDLSFQ